MKLLFIFAAALLLLSAGCIKTGAKDDATGGAGGQTIEQKTTGIDLGISDSDLQIDDSELDPTIDEFEEVKSPS
ncbi:MAG: hypothetical protein ACPL06_02355 [Candidatus Anstonellales archaeon]